MSEGKMKPQTALPWNYEHIGVSDMGPNGDDVYDIGPGEPMQKRVATATNDDALYIVHAANAYPRLVQMVNTFMQTTQHGSLYDEAKTLLSELGEL